MLQIASSFDLTTVAEVVGSAVQVELLRKLRWGLAQGYRHSRAVPPQELIALLADGTGRPVG